MRDLGSFVLGTRNALDCIRIMNCCTIFVQDNTNAAEHFARPALPRRRAGNGQRRPPQAPTELSTGAWPTYIAVRRLRHGRGFRLSPPMARRCVNRPHPPYARLQGGIPQDAPLPLQMASAWRFYGIRNFPDRGALQACTAATAGRS
jgi:hypothetical protein